MLCDFVRLKLFGQLWPSLEPFFSKVTLGNIFSLNKVFTPTPMEMLDLGPFSCQLKQFHRP